METEDKVQWREQRRLQQRRLQLRLINRALCSLYDRAEREPVPDRLSAVVHREAHDRQQQLDRVGRS
jgi:hypothetical protein